MYYPIIYHPKKAQKPEKTHQQWQLQLMSLRLRGNCGNTKRIHGLDLMGSWTLEPPGHGDGHGWPWMAMDGHSFYTINGDKQWEYPLVMTDIAIENGHL